MPRITYEQSQKLFAEVMAEVPAEVVEVRPEVKIDVYPISKLEEARKKFENDIDNLKKQTELEKGVILFEAQYKLAIIWATLHSMLLSQEMRKFMDAQPVMQWTDDDYIKNRDNGTYDSPVFSDQVKFFKDRADATAKEVGVDYSQILSLDFVPDPF